MKLLAALFGFLALLLGAGYLYRPDKVSDFNNWCRNNLFSDRLLLIHRRRTGVLLIFAGLAILSIMMKWR